MRFLALVFAAGCAQAAVPKPQPVYVPPVCVSAPETKKPAVPEPPRESACFKKGRPRAPVAEKKDDSTYCSPVDANELARVEARIRKDFVAYTKPSKLVVDFGCDAIVGNVSAVVLEDGSGHGGTLRIVRFERAYRHVDVRMIASSHYYNAGTVISTAQMATADFDAIVAQARVAVLAKPHLIPLATSGMGLGMSGSVSSNDFHLGLRLEGDDKRVVERHFTGYESSDSQEEILPMRMATERFEAALGTLAFAKQSGVTDEDRALFTSRFLAANKEGERPFWWITERMVSLAGELGTIDVVPTLVKIAQRKGGDGSVERTQPVALAAIATITGWDPRTDEHGKPREIDEAVAAAARECSP